MACYTPLAARLSPSGRPVVVRRVKGVSYPVELRCGQCIGCLLQRSSDWAVRCVHESQLHRASCFITLTYNDENLPRFGSLQKADFTKFMKRLRHHTGPLRYLMCGEYGEKNRRPHFHALLFGTDFAEDRYHWKTSRKNKLYRSPTLEKAWTLGHCDIGSMTYESAAYVARYVTKKQQGPTANLDQYRIPGYHPRDFRLTAEFNEASRNRGLAAGWIERYWRDVYPKDSCHINGKSCRPPRYYDKWLEKHHPATWTQVQEQRRRKAEETKDAPERTPQRLMDREVLAHNRTSRFSRQPEEVS